MARRKRSGPPWWWIVLLAPQIANWLVDNAPMLGSLASIVGIATGFGLAVNWLLGDQFAIEWRGYVVTKKEAVVGIMGVTTFTTSLPLFISAIPSDPVPPMIGMAIGAFFTAFIVAVAFVTGRPLPAVTKVEISVGDRATGQETLTVTPIPTPATTVPETTFVPAFMTEAFDKIYRYLDADPAQIAAFRQTLTNPALIDPRLGAQPFDQTQTPQTILLDQVAKDAIVPPSLRRPEN